MNAGTAHKTRLWERARSLIVNLALAAVAMLASLVPVELYLRHRGLFEVKGVHAGCHIFSTNPKIMYELEPGCGDANSFGMRDREYSLSSDAFRIAALGDSITNGPNVTLSETYPKRLEELIRRDESLGPTDVLNFGVMGYSTVQEVETLRQKGLQFNPRVVILQYFLNDDEIYTTVFNALIQELRHSQLDAYMGALDQGRARARRWLASTRTYLGIRFLIEKLRRAKPPPSALDLKPQEWPSQGLDKNVVKAYYQGKDPVRLGFADLDDLSRQYGFSVLVVLFPAYYKDIDVYPAETRHAEVMALCRQFGFHCLDLIQEIRKSPEDRKVVGMDFFADRCCHPAARGFAIIAEVIYKELKNLGLLPLRNASSSSPVAKPAIDPRETGDDPRASTSRQ